MTDRPPFAPDITVELPVRLEREQRAKEVDAANIKLQEL